MSSLFGKQTPSPTTGTASRHSTVSPAELGGSRPAAAADPNELLMLRSLFKDLPRNPEPTLISSALGKYASYLSQTKDARVNLADEFFQSSLSVCAENPCPRAVHTYHWFLCSKRRDYRSMVQYERLRSRAPIRGQNAAALLSEFLPSHSIGTHNIDAAACLANFLDELCLCAKEAGVLWDGVMKAAKGGAEPLQSFTQCKYAAFLLRHRPEQADEAKAIFTKALAAEPDNLEGLVDFASILSATSLLQQGDNVMFADEWFRSALTKAPDDSRVLSIYAVFLASPHRLRDVDRAETLHRRAVTQRSNFYM